jgi:hypothetical protein
MAVPAHKGKRQLMVPGGRFMTEDDPVSLCPTMPDRQVVLKSSDAKQVYCSVLSTHYLSVKPGTFEP